jgi:hypothetical protein
MHDRARRHTDATFTAALYESVGELGLYCRRSCLPSLCLKDHSEFSLKFESSDRCPSAGSFFEASCDAVHFAKRSIVNKYPAKP